MLTLGRESFDPTRRDPALSRIVIIPPGSGPVRVTVVEILHGKVRLGFEADADTQILREEIYNATMPPGQKQPRRQAP
jgi:sRNA-binding carbon storage regulator CsrA